MLIQQDHDDSKALYLIYPEKMYCIPDYQTMTAQCLIRSEMCMNFENLKFTLLWTAIYRLTNVRWFANIKCRKTSRDPESDARSAMEDRRDELSSVP